MNSVPMATLKNVKISDDFLAQRKEEPDYLKFCRPFSTYRAKEKASISKQGVLVKGTVTEDSLDEHAKGKPDKVNTDKKTCQFEIVDLALLIGCQDMRKLQKFVPGSTLEESTRTAAKYVLENREGLKDEEGFCKILPTVIKAYNLTKTNMQGMYDESCFAGKGWQNKSKWEELTSSDSRFLLVFESNDKQLSCPPWDEMVGSGTYVDTNVQLKNTLNIDSNAMVGFLHYRFEKDEYNEKDPHKPVIYIWDLQICANSQNKGLGKHLMNTVELVARLFKISKLQCTVLKINKPACRFYRQKCSFILDESSPDMFATIEDDPCEYDILKKELPLR